VLVFHTNGGAAMEGLVSESVGTARW
jgi:hypothetical protein